MRRSQKDLFIEKRVRPTGHAVIPLSCALHRACCTCIRKKGLPERVHHEERERQKTDQVKNAERAPLSLLPTLHAHAPFDVFLFLRIVETRLVRESLRLFSARWRKQAHGDVGF
jgi:hypothetical protein